jgi:2-amino-4-hydroxy-6-hydroxymethyldihydropteridine diphosphokinase
MKQLYLALDWLDKKEGISIEKHSYFYQSAPLGPQDQPDFLNAVCKIKTILSPERLLETTQHIEQKMGRIKHRHWGERCIDIDILLYDDLRISTESLQIPHSQITQRDFVLIPLLEIEPEVKLPDNTALKSYLKKLSSNHLVKL